MQDLRVPGVTQQVNYPAAAAQFSVVVLSIDSVLAQCSGLRIQQCLSCEAGCSCSSDSIPGPGTSTCHECGQKKRKRNIGSHMISVFLFLTYLTQYENL